MERIYLKQFFDGEFRARCHTKLFDLKAEYAYSDEPVPFKALSSLVFQPIEIGEVWAKKNFACAWFI